MARGRGGRSNRCHPSSRRRSSRIRPSARSSSCFRAGVADWRAGAPVARGGIPYPRVRIPVSPAEIPVSIPNKPSLVGVSIFTQGLLLDIVQNFGGVTEGMELVIGP